MADTCLWGDSKRMGMTTHSRTKCKLVNRWAAGNMIDRLVDKSEMASHMGFLLRTKPWVCIQAFQVVDMVECFPLAVCSMR